MRPEAIHELHAPLRLQPGLHYPPMEVRVAPDFAYTQTEIVPPALQHRGAVYAPAGAHGIELPFLRVVGFPTWNQRLARDSSTDWQLNLWELSGLSLLGCRGVRIGRLEVDGLPCGLRTEGASGWSLDSAFLRRCAKAIDVRFNIQNGIGPTSFTIRNVTQVDGRLDRAQDPSDAWRAKTARTEGDLLSGKSGSYITGEDYEVTGFAQHGDSFAIKTAGTRYRVANLHGSHVFLSGASVDNLTAYPGSEYRHLHESRDVVFEDFRLVGSEAAFVDRVLLRVSYPFANLLVRGGTFVRGTGPNGVKAAQINWTAVHFEDCDFVGWTNMAGAVELGPADPAKGYPAASITQFGCRFWAS